MTAGSKSFTVLIYILWLYCTLLLHIFGENHSLTSCSKPIFLWEVWFNKHARSQPQHNENNFHTMCAGRILVWFSSRDFDQNSSKILVKIPKTFHVVFTDSKHVYKCINKYTQECIRCFHQFRICEFFNEFLFQLANREEKRNVLDQREFYFIFQLIKLKIFFGKKFVKKNWSNHLMNSLYMHEYINQMRHCWEFFSNTPLILRIQIFIIYYQYIIGDIVTWPSWPLAVRRTR